jgi:hypothetical protein
MLRLGLPLMLLALGASPAAAQRYDVEPSADSVRIGQVVTLKERIHIGSQQDVVSRSAVLADLPEGVRLISQDTLTRHSNADMMRDGRALLTGEVRLAFFRPGRQRVPPLRVILKGVASDRGLPLESEAQYVEVIPTLPAGNPSLKDIRDQKPETTIDPMLVAAGAVLLLGLGWLGTRWWRRRPVAAAALTVVRAPVTAVESARQALARIEQEGWAERGDMARYYEAIAGVMRQYLGTVEPQVHAAQTSTELLRVLAARRTNGAWHGAARVFGDADLVKFAGISPDVRTARAYAAGARHLIDAWAGEPEAG